MEGRKKEQRASAKLEKEEKESFLGVIRKDQVPKFGEVADAPPAITIKRKGGGGGGKLDLNSGGSVNRQSKIFNDLMSKANDSVKNKNKRKVSSHRHETKTPIAGGLKAQHDLAVLREELIANYRELKKRPMTNGRS